MYFDAHELEQYVADILTAAGTDPTESRQLATALVWADACGRSEQGVVRLDVLARRVQEGLIVSPVSRASERVSGSAARIDGGDGFGHLAGAAAADLAANLAQNSGCACVTVSRSNFAGALAWTSLRLADHGCVGLVVSNSFAKVAAHGGVSPVLGTNPLAFVAPRENGDHLLVDMATAALAGSELRRLNETGGTLPHGAAVGPDGAPASTPLEAAKGALLPMAGGRGFGLALMVEVLAGVLADASIGPDIGSMYRDWERSGGNGHAVLALNPTAWMSPRRFFDRMERLASVVLGSGPGVRLPGAARWAALREAEARGVQLSPRAIASLERTAARYHVPMIAPSAPSERE